MNAPSHASNPKLADFANAAFKTRWYRYSEILDSADTLYCLFCLSSGNPSVNQDFPNKQTNKNLVLLLVLQENRQSCHEASSGSLGQGNIPMAQCLARMAIIHESMVRSLSKPSVPCHIYIIDEQFI